jgi:hypothetical protein
LHGFLSHKPSSVVHHAASSGGSLRSVVVITRPSWL